MDATSNCLISTKFPNCHPLEDLEGENLEELKTIPA